MDPLGLFSSLLQFIGAGVAFSVVFVSYKGVRQTQSATLLRLTAAFVFLGTGFVLQGMYSLGTLDLLQLPTFVATVLLAGLFLETAGYFFLAFSHVIDVLLTKNLAGLMAGAALFPVFAINQTNLQLIMESLSFYFILYGVVETLWSYRTTKNPNTLVIAVGFSLMAVGWWLYLASFIGIDSELLRFLQLVLKEVGLLTLLVPVLGYSFGRVRVVGPV